MMRRILTLLTLLLLLAIPVAADDSAADPTELAIDVKPGNDAEYAPVNLASGGTVTVAVLGNDEIDGTDVDPATVQLEGIDPWKTFVDLNGNGSTLICQFLVQSLLLEEGKHIVTLTGETYDGQPIIGSGGISAFYRQESFPGKGR